VSIQRRVFMHSTPRSRKDQRNLLRSSRSSNSTSRSHPSRKMWNR